MEIEPKDINSQEPRKEKKEHSKRKRKIKDEEDGRRDSEVDKKKRRRSKSKKNRNKGKDILGEKDTGEEGKTPKKDFSDFDKIAEKVRGNQED